MIVTFYSFKGGVGRSMTLVNIAELLADAGYKVIVCDWDLEAPGLERYFSEDPERVLEFENHPGVIDLLLEYKENLAKPQEKGSDREDHVAPKSPDKGKDFVQIGESGLWV